jgi:hypothetical protein
MLYQEKSGNPAQNCNIYGKPIWQFEKKLWLRHTTMEHMFVIELLLL